jgi:phosphate transport system protein
MDRRFDIELKKLNDKLVEMSKLTQDQVTLCMKALVTCDVALANQIIDNDNEIDDLDVKIDKLCQRIFALQQPVASDLRFIMSALKINNELERMGDLAVYIAKRIHQISDYQDIINELTINELAEMTEKLVRDSGVIIESKRTVFVRDIFESAQAVKIKARSISAKILDEMLQKNEVIVVATNLMQILGQIERLAAYCKNIAESVFFIVEGKIVKHNQNFN